MFAVVQRIVWIYWLGLTFEVETEMYYVCISAIVKYLPRSRNHRQAIRDFVHVDRTH
jgi:hypothetical protein